MFADVNPVERLVRIFRNVVENREEADNLPTPIPSNWILFADQANDDHAEQRSARRTLSTYSRRAKIERAVYDVFNEVAMDPGP